MQTSNHTILITGGTSGIGLELVRQFYRLGNNIVVASSNAKKLAELKSEFPKIEIISCDLGDSVSVRELIDYCLTEYKEINIIINNAVFNIIIHG